jgi:hypothetical protein
MFKTLAANPRTSLAGLLMMGTGITHIIFAISKHTATETDISATVTSILTGLGLMAAGDAAKPDKPATPPTT